MKYDIFISYRRDGGFEIASLIKSKLQRKGYRVFIDMEDLQGGHFNSQLYKIIDQCKDVLLVCSPGALERCSNPEDWVKTEISYAMQKKKTIIPVLMKGFSISSFENLPIEMADLKNYQMAFLEPDTFSDGITRLCRKYIDVLPMRKIKTVSIFIGIVILCCVSVILIYSYQQTGGLSKTEIKTIDQICSTRLSELNSCMQQSISMMETCKDALLTGDNSNISSSARIRKKAIDEIRAISLPSAENIQYSGSDALQKLQDMSNSKDRYSQYIDFAEWLMKESPKSSEDKEEIIDTLTEIIKYDYTYALNLAYGVFLPFSEKIKYEKDEAGEYVYSTIVFVSTLTDNTLGKCHEESFFGSINGNMTNADFLSKIEQAEGNRSKKVSEIKEKVGSKWKEFVNE